jgi:hypothetical protein
MYYTKFEDAQVNPNTESYVYKKLWDVCKNKIFLKKIIFFQNSKGNSPSRAFVSFYFSYKSGFSVFLFKKFSHPKKSGSLPPGLPPPVGDVKFF